MAKKGEGPTQCAGKDPLPLEEVIRTAVAKHCETFGDSAIVVKEFRFGYFEEDASRIQKFLQPVFVIILTVTPASVAVRSKESARLAGNKQAYRVLHATQEKNRPAASASIPNQVIKQGFAQRQASGEHWHPHRNDRLVVFVLNRSKRSRKFNSSPCYGASGN